MLVTAKEIIFYDVPVITSDNCRTKFIWWVNNISTAFMPVIQGNPEVTLTTDASCPGWGTVNLDNKTGGFWNLEEHQYHINYLELTAVMFGLKSFCSIEKKKHIRIQSDDTMTTRVAILNTINLMTAMIWHSKFGTAVRREICGLVLPISLAAVILKPIESLGTLMTPPIGLCLPRFNSNIHKL